ncbi:MAG TPA: hypothetical protein VFG83_16835 [Kofleriaceae bacterium]|nr:hypothetical protein [Kofleriaceae bacterium]
MTTYQLRTDSMGRIWRDYKKTSRVITQEEADELLAEGEAEWQTEAKPAAKPRRRPRMGFEREVQAAADDGQHISEWQYSAAMNRSDD